MRQSMTSISGSAFKFPHETDFISIMAQTNNISMNDRAPLHYNDGVKQVFRSFLDWAVKHPIELKNSLDFWYARFRHPITEMFDSFLSNEEYFTQRIIEFEKVDLQQMSMNAPTRKVHFKESTKQGQSVITGQGLKFDWYHLMTSDGPADFEFKLQILRADIIAFDLAACLNVFFVDVNSYNNDPNQLYPFENQPQTIEDMYRIQRRTYFRLIKDPYAMYTMVNEANRIFGQRSSSNINAVARRCKRILMSSHDAYYCLSTLNMQQDYTESGPTSLRLESTVTPLSDIAGAEIIALPFIQQESHNWTDALATKHMRANGTYYKWYDPNMELEVKDVRSRHRNAGLYNYRSNDYTIHTYIEFLEKCIDFTADGSIDWKSKQILMERSESNDNSVNILRRCGCEKNENNYRNLDWALYRRPKCKMNAGKITSPTIPDDEKKVALRSYRYMLLVGEVPEEDMKERYLRHHAEVLASVLYQTGSLNQPLVDELLNLNGNPLRYRETYVNTYSTTTYGAFDDILDVDGKTPRSFFAKVLNSGEEFYTNEQLRRNKLDKLIKTAAGAGKTDRKYFPEDINNPNMFHQSAGRAGNDGSLAEHLRKVGNFLETLDEPCEISRFDVLYMKSYSLPPKVGFAMRLLLFLPRTVEMGKLLSRHNIPVPMGGMMVRNLETSWSHDCIMVGDTKLGKRAYWGPDSWVSFLTNTQELDIQMQYKTAYLFDDPDKWFTQSNVIPGAYIAGKGDGYITDVEHAKGSNDSRVGIVAKKAFENALPTELRNNDWIPIMTTYNFAMEEANHAIDVTGFWSVASTVGQLHRSVDFDTLRKTPMFSGVFFLNQQINFMKHAIYNMDDLKKLNQLQRASMERANTACQPATFMRFDHISGKKREYNATQHTSYHLLGPQVPGRYELETGLTPPSQEFAR